MSEPQHVRLLIIYTALSTQHWGCLTPKIRASQGNLLLQLMVTADLGSLGAVNLPGELMQPFCPGSIQTHSPQAC